jgi:type III restriction enzyme
LEWGYDLDDLFPTEKVFPQKELVDSGPVGLYNQTQIDSEVEKNFVETRLLDNNQVVFYFKFPPSFRIQMPKVIGNYNPDWGIAYYGPDRRIILELIRETKGGIDLEKLQFPQEKRKIECARKHFKAVGIDYRVVTDHELDWWKVDDDISKQEGLNL